MTNSFFLRIESDFNCIAKIDDKYVGEIKETQNGSITIKILKPADFTISFYPTNSKINNEILLSFSSTCSLKNGKLLCSSKQLSAIKFPNSLFVISVRSLKVENETSKILLENLSKTIGTKEAEINIYSCPKRICEIKYNNNYFNYKIPYLIKNQKILIKNCKNTTYFCIFAELFNNKNYLLAINENNFNEIFEILADKIDIDDLKISQISKQKDISKHVVISTFMFEEKAVSLKQKMLAYENEEIIVANEKLVPFAFFEAIMVQNFSLARNYISLALSEKLSDLHLKNFFAKFDKISKCPFSENCFALSSASKTDFFKISFSNKIISNIEEIIVQ
ncbi:MAG: hypothetical protein RR400_01810 [Clostridia bacterium]